MSILRPLYFPKTPAINEWTQVSALSSHFLSKSRIFQGKLSFTSPQGSEVSQSLVLNSAYLSFQQGQFLYIFNIKWTVIDPFIDETSPDPRYGFTIKLSQMQKFDFFTESVQDLELWLDSLGSVTFLTNFEYWFYSIKMISSKDNIDLYLCQSIYKQSEFIVVRIEKIQDIKLMNLVFNEITVLRKLNHPNIARVVKLFEDRDFFNLVLNCKLCIPLAVMIGTRFDEIDLILFARNLLEVVNYVHSNGIILRELKVENILVNKDQIKDFQIVDVTGSCIIGKTRIKDDDDCAPFQGSGMKIDIFCAGLIIFQLAAGVRITEPGIKSFIEKRGWRKEIGRCRIDEIGKQFLMALVDEDPHLRLTASEALQHAWINTVHLSKNSRSESKKISEGSTASKLTMKIENY